MGLKEKIDDTKFRSLKYGGDTPGGGWSGQPYIKGPDLKDVDNSFNQLRFTRFDDGLIRGGMVGALNASVTDTIRIGKFLIDFPKGPLFITKQVGLQLSNPKLEIRRQATNRPISGQGLLNNIGNFISNTAGRINNNLGPTRIYNLGINTLAQVAVNAFGGHITRHGFLPVQDESSKYINVVRDNNRVSVVDSQFSSFINTTSGFQILAQDQENIISSNRLITTFNKLNIARPQYLSSYKQENINVIDDYIGGPGSVYGIGNTFIKRYDNTSDIAKQTELKNLSTINSNNAFSKINWYKTQGLSLKYFSKEEREDLNNVDEQNPTNKPEQVDQNKSTSYSSLRNEIENTLLKNGGPGKFNADGGLIANEFNIMDTENGKFLYKNTQKEIIYYNGTTTLTITGSWNEMNRETRIGSGKQDSINLTPLFKSLGAPGTEVNIPGIGKRTIRDLIKFRIEAIDTDSPDLSTWMIFRAYLKGFKDNPNADWNATKYIGRGESFYTYNGFSREISFSFQVAALSAQEMEPMYQKLNFLISNMAPDYNEDGVMRGPLMRLTVGNYLYRQPGFIKVNYSISDETPWEIALDEPERGNDIYMYELPHIIDVNLTFTPIHSFLPRKDASAPFIVDKGEEDGVKNPWLQNIPNPLPRI